MANTDPTYAKPAALDRARQRLRALRRSLKAWGSRRSAAGTRKALSKSVAERAREHLALLRQRWPAPGGGAPKPAKPRPVLPDAIPFQSELDEIVEELPPRFIRGTLYFVAALVVSMITIAALVNVDIVVQGGGQLTADMPSIVLQPMERGIIRELKVKVGDTVKKGQVLATLDPTFIQADMAALSAQELSLSAQLRRIEAEVKGVAFEAAAPSRLASPAPAANPHDAVQAALYRQRQAQYASRLAAFDGEIQRGEATIRTLEGGRGFQAQQLAITRDVEAMRASLLESQTGSKLQYLESQSLRLRAERELQDTADRLPELRHNLQARRAERQSFIDQWRRDLLEELVRVRAEAARINESLVKTSRMRDLVVVRAPEDAVVLNVAQRSVGSVIREAEPLVVMVPSNAVLIADIKVTSGDVGYVRPGDEVVLKVDAFPYQRHGMLKGRLQSISEESFGPGPSQANSEAAGNAMPVRGSDGGAFHRARIELNSIKLQHMPEGARLIPGMTLSAEVKVGARSVISFFLYPLKRGFDESIREP
jgi:hemolysin D